jgi:menaquinone-9 beta-reductase
MMAEAHLETVPPGASSDIVTRMPKRRTTGGSERVPLGGEWDAIVCGASFAGLALAGELSGTGARVLLLDR